MHKVLKYICMYTCFNTLLICAFVLFHVSVSIRHSLRWTDRALVINKVLRGACLVSVMVGIIV